MVVKAVSLNAPCSCGSGKKYKRCCGAPAPRAARSLPPSPPGSVRDARIAAFVLIAAGLLAYWNSFSGVFLFDDIAGITENVRLRQLWPVWGVWKGSARPLAELSLALNYAFARSSPWSYHLVNLAVHLAAALALFGLMRRTLARPCFSEDLRHAALWLACGTALVWELHPLQTQSVTYVVQRAEAMMGLFFLLTLYCSVRWMEWGRSRWLWGATAACVCGMASKSVMVTAPLVTVLYARTFFEDGEDRRPRRPLYAALFMAWLPLIAFVWTVPEGAGVGASLEGVTRGQYLATQPGVLLHYLKLVFWPYPLVLDYGWPVAHGVKEVLVPGAAVLALIALTVYGCVKRRVWGFLGAWVFIILAPTSSFIPLQDLAFEHRMYLPLAAFTAFVTVGMYRLAGRLGMPDKPRAYAVAALVLLLAAGETVLTVRRNEDYRDQAGFWSDAIAKRPLNPRAYNNLCMALQDKGKPDEAAGYCEEALRLRPDYAKAHYNLGRILMGRGKSDEAASHYAEAVRLLPDYAKAHNNLGLIYLEKGRLDEAASQFEEAVDGNPYMAEAHFNLGLVLYNQGRRSEAVPHFGEALRLRPDFSKAEEYLQKVLSARGSQGSGTSRSL